MDLGGDRGDWTQTSLCIGCSSLEVARVYPAGHIESESHREWKTSK